MRIPKTPKINKAPNKSSHKKKNRIKMLLKVIPIKNTSQGTNQYKIRPKNQKIKDILGKIKQLKIN
jgi:hypothetical protein